MNTRMPNGPILYVDHVCKRCGHANRWQNSPGAMFSCKQCGLRHRIGKNDSALEADSTTSEMQSDTERPQQTKTPLKANVDLPLAAEVTGRRSSRSVSDDIDDLLRRRDSHFYVAAKWAFWISVSLLILELFAFSYAITPDASSISLAPIIVMFLLIGGLQFVFLLATIWVGRIFANKLRNN